METTMNYLPCLYGDNHELLAWEMRGPQSYSWWGGQWHFSWTASKYFIYGNFNVPILFELKTRLLSAGLKKKSTSIFYLVLCICYGLVNSKRAHPPPPPPGHLSGFVIFVWKSCKCPTVGLGGFFKTSTQRFKKSVQIPTPGQYQNFIFQQISCKCHIYGNLWKSESTHWL